MLIIGDGLYGQVELRGYEPRRSSVCLFCLTVFFGAVCGYVQLRNRENLRFMRDENSLLRERLAFLRDLFGAHTYGRVDKPGVFHTLWAEEGKPEIEAPLRKVYVVWFHQRTVRLAGVSG